MRILVVCSISWVFATIEASAIQLSDFAGTWGGSRVEKKNGFGRYSDVEIVAKVTPGGLSITETGKLGGIYTFKHTFKKGGKYHSTLIKQGFILATNSGTWRKVGNSISVSGTQKSASGNAAFQGTLSLPTENKLIYTGKAGSVRIRIVGKRH